MPKSLMQSVLGPLMKERRRLEAQLRAVTAALAAFEGFRQVSFSQFCFCAENLDWATSFAWTTSASKRGSP
jgi:hypothetical protein